MRGDTETVRKHVRAMRSAGELPAQMYASAALCGLPHAAEKGVATEESIEEIESVLREALQGARL